MMGEILCAVVFMETMFFIESVRQNFVSYIICCCTFCLSPLLWIIMTIYMTVWDLEHIPYYNMTGLPLHGPTWGLRMRRWLSTHVVRWSRQPASGLWHMFVAVPLFSFDIRQHMIIFFRLITLSITLLPPMLIS